MKITILFVLLLLGIIVLWPRKRPPKKDFREMTPEEIVYSWSVFTTIHTGAILRCNWESDTLVKISVVGKMNEEQKEVFVLMEKQLKEKLPDTITVEINVEN